MYVFLIFTNNYLSLTNSLLSDIFSDKASPGQSLMKHLTYPNFFWVISIKNKPHNLFYF